MAAALRSSAPATPDQVIAGIWQRSLPIVRHRITVLNAAARRATDGHLSGGDRREAADIAHKLAGSLGMFGYMRGSEIAHQLEILLETEGPVAAARFQELALELGLTLKL